jgi:hypothetical protein
MWTQELFVAVVIIIDQTISAVVVRSPAIFFVG